MATRTRFKHGFSYSQDSEALITNAVTILLILCIYILLLYFILSTYTSQFKLINT